MPTGHDPRWAARHQQFVISTVHCSAPCLVVAVAAVFPWVVIKRDICEQFLCLAELARVGGAVCRSPIPSTLFHVRTMASVSNPELIQHIKSLPASINAHIITEVSYVRAPGPRGGNVAPWKIPITCRYLVFSVLQNLFLPCQ